MQILIYGSLKDEIQINTEIKQGNEKKVIDEAKAQIAELIGYGPFEYKGGNHIKLENIETKEIFYCIEWHDTNEEINFNIIKRVCKEQGLTYKQLGELIGYSEATLNKNASTNEISKPIEVAINLYLETIRLKRELRRFHLLKKLIRDIFK